MNPINFVVQSYESATRPMYTSRAAEFGAVAGYAKAYGLDLTEEEFDMAIAFRFGGGCEYEWPEN